MSPPSYIAEVTLSTMFGNKIETIIFEMDNVGGLYCEKDDTNTWYSFKGDDVKQFYDVYKKVLN